MSKIAPYFPPDPYYKQVWQAVTNSDGSIYLRMEDEVRLSVFTTTAGLTITLNGIFVDLEGELKPFEMQLVTAGSGTRESTTRFLGPGFLLYCYPTLSGGTPAVGAVTVSLELLQSHNTGGPIVKQLFFGALTAQGYYPNVQIGNTVTVSGSTTVSNFPNARTITVADPAPGAEFVVTVPAATTYLVHSINYKIVFSAAVANRAIRMTFTDGTNKYAEYEADSPFTASQQAFATFANGVQKIDPTIGTNIFSPEIYIPVMALGPGYTITSRTINMDVADQISLVKISAMVYST